MRSFLVINTKLQPVRVKTVEFHAAQR